MDHMLHALIILLILSVSYCKIYIYDNWPHELEDVWPPAGATLHPEAGYSHEFRGNGGAGQLIDASLGIYQTWQFAFFQMMIHRLRTSTWRTFDPREATAFIIPFDLGVHSHLDHKNGRLRLASPHGWTAIRLLKEAQRDKVLWRREGHDHYLLFGITAYQMVGIGVKSFFMNGCENCTVLTIETSPTRTAIPGRGKKYWYAQPYPSFFHFTEGMTTYPWDIRPLEQRDILALFIGSIRTKTPTSNRIRKLLYKQCSSSSKCIWRRTAHTCQGVGISLTSFWCIICSGGQPDRCHLPFPKGALLPYSTGGLPYKEVSLRLTLGRMRPSSVYPRDFDSIRLAF